MEAFIKRIQHFWYYEKHYIIIAAVALFVAGSLIFRVVSKKDADLYVATVNVVKGDTLEQVLKDDFLAQDSNEKNGRTMTLYSGLYLTADTKSEFYGYTYSSEAKIVGAIDADQLDVVIMDREAFDAFAANDYLCEMDRYLGDNMPDFYEAHKKDLVSNTIITEDNADEVKMDSSVSYKAKTKEALLAINGKDSPIFKELGFKGDVYIGVIRDTPRSEAVCDYLNYLL